MSVRPSVTKCDQSVIGHGVNACDQHLVGHAHTHTLTAREGDDRDQPLRTGHTPERDQRRSRVVA